MEQVYVNRLTYSYIWKDVFFYFGGDRLIYFSEPIMTRKDDKEGNYGLIVGQPLFMEMGVWLDERTRFGTMWNAYHVIKHNTRGRGYDPDDEGVYDLFLNIWENGTRTLSPLLDSYDLDVTAGGLIFRDVLRPDLLANFNLKHEYTECWVNLIITGYFAGSNPNEYDKLVIENTYCNETAYPPILQFLMWVRTFDPNLPVNISALFVTADSQVLITEKQINYQKYRQNSSDFEINSHEIGPIPLTEFLSCQTTINNIRQVKGIFYNKNTFYVIFARYYVMIDEARIKPGEIPAELNLKAHNLKFEQEYYKAGGRYEMLHTLWVKVVDGQNYLIPDPQSKIIYQIHLMPDGRFNVLRKAKDPPNIDCAYNTLHVQNIMYCFEGRSID